MLSPSEMISIELLRAVIGGATVADAGVPHGMSRSAVRQRVVGLARRLHRTVGIAEITDAGVSCVVRLRARRAEVEAALGIYADGGQIDCNGIPALTREQVAVAIARVGRTGVHRNRDLALVHAVLATGAWPIELARLEVRDFLNPNGTVRARSMLRSESALNGTSRPLFFVAPAAQESILRYLTHRALARCRGASLETLPYLGLDPTERLFLDDGNKPFQVRQYVGKKASTRQQCPQMLQTFRRIFSRVGMPGISAKALRRTLAVQLWRAGAFDDEIALVLGIRDKKTVRAMLSRTESLEDLFCRVGRDG